MFPLEPAARKDGLAPTPSDVVWTSALSLDQSGHRAFVPAMALEILHIVQTYVQRRGKGLKAEPQVGSKTAEDARRKAERLAPLRLVVVAFSAPADAEMGDYDENTTILFRAGQLPPSGNEGD